MRIAVTGSSGFIGTALCRRLEQAGHQVTRVVRGDPAPGQVAWDPAAGTIDASGLEGHDGVVHLAGEGIGEHRWTAAHKARILDSRKAGTELLAGALAGLQDPPQVLVSGSAVGFYGDRGDEVLREDSGPGSGFLADVVRTWEAATRAAEDAGIRVVNIRTGLVMSAEDGALAESLPVFRLGLGGRLGSGQQWWSWISLDDEVGAIVHALQTPDLAGPVNLTGPEPVTNSEFTQTLGEVLNRPAKLFVPRVALALRFGGEMTDDMLLASQRAVPEKLLASGFEFEHPTLEAALRATLDDG
jgi:uncharacterized protein